MDCFQLDIKIEPDKNRLLAKFSGFPTLDDFDRLKDRLVEQVGRLRPDFTMLTDLTAMDLAAMREFALPLREIMSQLAELGLIRVARLTDDEYYGQLMDDIGRGMPYQSASFVDQAEAIAYLDECIHRDGTTVCQPDADGDN